MNEVFGIIPAAPKALIMLGAICLLLLGILAVMGSFAYASQATRFEIRPEGLTIRAGIFYGRTLPWPSLRLHDAIVADLSARPDLRPTMRTNGVGLPGYRAGWFRSRSGRGFLHLTDPSSVVVIPTTDGYTLMLSVEEPDRFVAALRNSSPGGVTTPQ